MTAETLAADSVGRLRRKAGIDLSLPILATTAGFLVLLIGLPVAWLLYYAVTDRAGSLTFANFVTLASDPSFTEPLVTTLILCVSVAIAAATVSGYALWLLFGGKLFAVPPYLIAAAVIVALGSLGFRLTQVRKFVGQYPWIYERDGLLGWRERR